MMKFTELKSTERKILKDVIPLDKPFTLLIEPSSLCNFKCKMCFQSADNKEFVAKRSNMSMECFEKIMKDCGNWPGGKLKVLKLCIYGEPFMNPEFLRMLENAKGAGIAERIETTTNGSLLTEEICRGLIENGLDYLRVSIYSAISEKHKQITESTVPMEKIYENLDMLKKIKKELGSKTPFVAAKMLDTFDKSENVVFKEKYSEVADEVYLDQPHNWVQVDDNSFIDKIHDENSMAESIKAERKACPMPFTTLAVRSNGDVSPCCIDWYGGTTVGNVKEQTIEELWKGDMLYAFQCMQLQNRKSENISCRNCEVFANKFYMLDDVDGVDIKALRDKKC